MFGIVALGRIKRDGTRGRGMAIAGIVLGAVLFVVNGIVVAAVVLPTIAAMRDAVEQPPATDGSDLGDGTGEDVDQPSGTELLGILPLEVDGLTTTGWRRSRP